jgi:signal transduction histidine kinase
MPVAEKNRRRKSDGLMFTTLRNKLLLGITPLVAIMLGLGLFSVVMFSRLGNNIDVILRENYRSVLAAEGMKEALERIDSSLLFAIGGEEKRARAQFEEFRPMFDRNFTIEENNITLPGEQEMVDALRELWGRYFALTGRFYALGPGNRDERTRLYFSELLPTFSAIKREADAILALNQKNMEVEDGRARNAAAVSIRLMMVAVLGAAIVATMIALVLSRSILEPIGAVTRGARAMAQGELDQVVPVVTRDELGELAAAFNTMASTIRAFRESGTARILRARQAAQATIDSFPDPVVVVDRGGSVERVNPSAQRIFSLSAAPEGLTLPWAPPPQLKAPLAEVLRGGLDSIPTGLDSAICLRDQGQERFFLPRIVAIQHNEGLLGAAVVLSDVTKFRLVDQLKSDMVATASHELKTPLTGVQMAVHLLLEETVGPLNAKQTELLLAAREESDRLLALVNDLLDLTRIEQGRLQLDLQPVAPESLLAEAVERFAPKADDLGVKLTVEAAAGVPPVEGDAERLGYVFDNLIGNALEFTPRGGAIRVSATAGRDATVRFSVADDGAGIAPEHLPHVFEKFYRAAGSRAGRAKGAGLGLAIVKEIVVAHGGQVDVQSQPGRGTVFTFTLPSLAGSGTNPVGVSSPWQSRLSSSER